MIPATIFTFFFALYCAHDDAKQIARHSKIYHGIQWTFRAAVVGAVCYLTATWWLAFAMAGLFSAVFRWRKNRLRRKDWRYISPSSWYDTTFIAMFQFGWLHMWGIKVARIIHGKMYKEVQEYRRDIHRAGTMAYIFEALLFVGVVVLYLHRAPWP